MKRQIKASILGVGMLAIAAASCTTGQQATETISGLNPAKFDSTINGKKTALYVLKNNNGMEVCITNFGARVVSLVVPDKDGKPTDCKIAGGYGMERKNNMGIARLTCRLYFIKYRA